MNGTVGDIGFVGQKISVGSTSSFAVDKTSLTFKNPGSTNRTTTGTYSSSLREYRN
jgi:hypothetical protein